MTNSVPPTSYRTVTPGEWTFLVYMNGIENGLFDKEVAVLNKLKETNVSAQVNVVYELASIDRRRRGRLGVGLEAQTIFEGPQNRTVRDSITDFLDWGTATFPSRYTALFLKDHGSTVDARDGQPPAAGAQSAPEKKKQWSRSWLAPKEVVGDQIVDGPQRERRAAFAQHVDDEAPGALSVPGLRTAVRRSRIGKVDLYGFDACSMAVLEFAYEVRDVASYVVASQGLVNAEAWPYCKAIEFVSRAHVGPRELAAAFPKFPVIDPSLKLSAFELGWARELASRVAQLGEALLAAKEFGIRPVTTFDPDYVDLHDVVDALRRSTTLKRDSIDYDEWLVMLADFCFAKSDEARSGIDLSFPEQNEPFRLARYGGLQFAHGNSWVDYLFRFVTNRVAPVNAAPPAPPPPPAPVADPREAAE